MIKAQLMKAKNNLYTVRNQSRKSKKQQKKTERSTLTQKPLMSLVSKVKGNKSAIMLRT